MPLMIFSRRGSPAPPTAVKANGTEASGDTAVPPDQPGPDPVLARVKRFARQHVLFGALLLAGAAVRVVAMLGFRGPLRTPDSTRYLTGAVHLAPSVVRPSGYSIMLWLLEPLHSLMAVVGVQYAMGLGISVIGYALARHLGLPGWGATLAMVPVLLSAYAVQLEHFLLSDTLFAFLVMIAVALMMWWPIPPVWACAVTGLLLAAAGLTRSEGTPLLIVFVIFLIIRFVGWRTIASVAVMCAAFAIPVAGYAAWYDSVHGTFELTSSTGAFLYGGIATFADCAKIKPPASERRLCVNAPLSERGRAAYYIWGGALKTIPGGPFGKRADHLGKDFALRAIRAQPLDYLRAAGRSFLQNFLPPPSIHAHAPIARAWASFQNQYMFPATSLLPLRPPVAREFSRYDPAGPSTPVVQPYAGWIRSYQRYIFVPGPLVGAIVLAGLGGMIVTWRRFGQPALLPWLVGLCLLVTPAAVVASTPRYLVGDIPPLCVAAALGVQQIAGAAKRFRAGHRLPAADLPGVGVL
jgi:hypothetical protein